MRRKAFHSLCRARLAGAFQDLQDLVSSLLKSSAETLRNLHERGCTCLQGVLPRQSIPPLGVRKLQLVPRWV